MNVEYLAPSKTEWVCAACGKRGKDRTMIGDESCFLNAVLCWEGTFKAVPLLPKWPTVEQLREVAP